MGGEETSFLDSVHMVSYFLAIQFKTINTTVKGKVGILMKLTFLIAIYWYKNAHKSLNLSPITL